MTYDSSAEISVIIPVYNAEKYLRECLDSVVNQTLRTIEIICVDDGSTDLSPQILEEYAARDSRLKILRQKNQFAGVARNNGMKIARGKYLCFLDADDVFDRTMLEKAFKRAEKYSADIVVWGGYVFSDSLKQKEMSKGIWDFSLLPKHKFWEKKLLFPHAICGRLFQLGWGVPWNKLFRRSFVEENKLKFSETRSSNDIYFVFAAMAIAGKIAYLKKYLVFYRRTGKGKSLQESFEKSPTDFIEAQEALNTFLCEKTDGAFNASFVMMAVCNSLWYLKRADSENASAIKAMLRERNGFFARRLPEDVCARFPAWEQNAYKELMEMLYPGK